MIQEMLRKLLSGGHLAENEATLLMDQIMEGHATPAQIGGLLIALKQKGEHVQEVTGFVRSMRNHSQRVSVADPNAVDGCGTGGDGAHTFNISTAAAIVASAAGATVAKHGNRSVSSKCGSADLLEATGGAIDASADIVKRCIDQVGFGFLFAPLFHPAMKHAAGPRKELGVRTVFNILGPMTNPAGVKRQVIGVYDPSLMHVMAEVLQRTGSTHVIIAHSRDGLDEFSISDTTEYVELHDGKITVGECTPETVGLKRMAHGAVVGGDAAWNLQILRELLDNHLESYGGAVVYNAGAMLYVAGIAGSIAEGVSAARESIADGRAKRKLQDWIAASRN